jgi:hypothetical protein
LDDDDDELTSVGNPSQESFCSLFSPGEESDPAEYGSKQSMFSFRDATEEEKEAARELLIFNHPFKKVRSMVSKAARMKKNAENGVDFDANDKAIQEFLVDLKALASCYSKKHREYLNCNCTNKLRCLDHAAAYLTTVAAIGKKEQYALYKELINGRRRVAHGYNLGSGDDMAIGYSMFLCRNSFLNIIGVGKTRYTNLQATRFTPGMNTHNNSGNSHAVMPAGTKQSVIDFINQKGKEEGEVYATRIIRILDGCELREEEKGVIEGQVLGAKRTDAINACELAILKPPGLRPIKQVELYKKLCPFVPRKFWEETCPKPGETVLAQVKDETAAKRKVKAAAANPEKAVAVEATAPQAKSAKAKAAPKAKAEATKRKAAGQ